MNREDIKLYKSQVMDDTKDGGGYRTLNEVVDGQTNEIFPDISSIDYVDGDFSLMKVFVGIDTPDTSKLTDAHIYITEPPESSLINVAMFKAATEAEQRPDALNRVHGFYKVVGEVMTVTSFNNGSTALVLNSPSNNSAHLVVGCRLKLHDALSGESQSVKVLSLSGVSLGGGAWQYNITVDHPVSERLQTLSGVGSLARVMQESPSNDFYYGVSTIDTAVTSGDLEVSVINAKQRIKPIFTTNNTETGSFKPSYSE